MPDEQIPFTRPNAEGEVSEWQKARAVNLAAEFYDGLYDIVATMLAKRWWNSQITQSIKPILIKHGLPHETPDIKTIITNAKGRMREAAGKSREDVKAEAIAFYEEMIRDESTDPVVKIKAQERLDKIFGTESKHDAFDADEKARTVRKALQALEEAYSDTAADPK